MGQRLRGVEEIFFTGQVDLFGRGDRTLHGVPKATVVLAQVGSDGLGNRARRLEEQGGAAIVKLID